MRHIILISGKDSLACALVQTTRQPEHSYEFVFNDVRAELPETYDWLTKVESKTGWQIQRVGESLPERIRLRGGFLPSRRARYCTRECKIEPMEAHLGDEVCTVYYGLRADEDRVGYLPLGKPNILPRYPLVEAGVDLRGVYAILEAQNLMPPDFFWPRLHRAVTDRLANVPDWEQRLTAPERRYLFAGRTRANCSFCFFQRSSEFLWLLETHPDLYAEAEAFEKEEYSFKEGLFLRDLRQDQAKQQAVFAHRVKTVTKEIHRRLQGELFAEAVDNELALISCGLLCGK